MSSPLSGHSPPRNLAGAEAYRNYAKGGHVEADANIAATAKTLTAQVRQQKADDDMAKALFGVDGTCSSSSVSFDEDSNAKLVGRSPDGNGGSRRKWVELFESNHSATGGMGEAGMSLLD